MPSDRKQINVRLDEEAEQLIEKLIPAVRFALGIPISQSDLFRLGMRELAKKYLTAAPAPPSPPPAPTGKGRGRKRSG